MGGRLLPDPEGQEGRTVCACLSRLLNPLVKFPLLLLLQGQWGLRRPQQLYDNEIPRWKDRHQRAHAQPKNARVPVPENPPLGIVSAALSRRLSCF